MNKTILAIDDEESMLAFYTGALSEFGVVRTAASFPETMQKLAGVDLILLDFNFEQAEKRNPEMLSGLKKAAPIILCSWLLKREVQIMAAARGFEGYWDKCSDYKLLRALVGSILNPGKTAAPFQAFSENRPETKPRS